ncbi:MAG: hypothetical protein M3Y87_30595 [Myxococcota bacterium]|nr:hypothetical protein [Myxococcota bacterium]
MPKLLRGLCSALGALGLIACAPSSSWSLPPDAGSLDGGPFVTSDSSVDDCPPIAHARSQRVGASCLVECDRGWSDCNGTLSDGCEVDLQTDVAHCGACEMACPGASGGLPHVVPACRGGTCAQGCERGWADCDGDVLAPGSTNGCEAALESDRANCGTCRNACASSCTAGACEGVTLPCEYFATERAHPVSVAAASDGTAFLVAWNDFRREQLLIAALDERGRAIGPSRVLVDPFESYWRYDLAHDGTDYVLAYEDESADPLFAQRLDAAGASVGAATRLADDGAVAVRAAGGNGEAWIGAGSALHRLRGEAIESVELGGQWTSGLATGAGSLAVTAVSEPGIEPGTTVTSLEWHATNGALVRTGGGPLDAAGVRTFSISGAREGAVIVASIRDPRTFLPRVRAWGFGASGPSGPVTLATAGAPGAMDIDGFGPAWLGYVDQDTSIVELLAIEPDGRASSATRLATPRAGFLGAITVAASDTRVLAIWVWRSFGGSSDLHAIEGATMRVDGTLERPCE